MDTEPLTPSGVVPSTGTAKKRGKSFTLINDTKGATVNSAMFVIYAVICLTISLRAEPNTLWFYVFYFLTFLAVFQGGTIVLRHCLHILPKSVVMIDIVGKVIRVTRKNGSVIDITREVDYTRRKNMLVIQGQTHDNQKLNEVIRESALPDGELDKLVSALKRFR